MAQAVLVAAVSAIIAGIFGLAGKVLDAKLQSVLVSTTKTQTVSGGMPPYQPVTPQYQPGVQYPPNRPGAPQYGGQYQAGQAGIPYPPYQTSTSVTQTVIAPSPLPATFSFGRVLIHIGVLQLVANVAGLIIGLTLGSSGTIDPGTFLAIVLIAGTLILIIGFAWVATRVNRVIRWKHLFYVAIGVIIVTLLLNAILLQTTITPLAIVVACVQTFLGMAIGGAIGSAIKK